MEANFSKARWQAFSLGAISGMRSTAAPMLLSHFLSNSPEARLENSFLRHLQSSKVAIGLKILTGGELIGDKLPQTGDRISLPQIIPRILAGALVGATICEANGERKVRGALLGGLGAVAASYAFFYLRKKLGQSSSLPDTVFALLEDALTITSGVAILKNK